MMSVYHDVRLPLTLAWHDTFQNGHLIQNGLIPTWKPFGEIPCPYYEPFQHQPIASCLLIDYITFFNLDSPSS
ncbi:uncharacterized protein MELLADRAFT_86754 [Melampsora larici-populina 98AG31]|uniref:Uncharacterized protein n=1 Tax=Melampsora larici-populina (strain 98AG31 / pathotype 3-4-7) TaxID=747676 RepID=F4R3A1_MELLP|nr:uncharacterized protein MELLADRAFT_86754 [Melampsora larici-populina 98AG31]EGG13204.1 hypothetical protein MELLADRAFT_86754 [Melampsora larici-populina 98AG31]